MSGRREIQFWRDDAFAAAAAIVCRYVDGGAPEAEGAIDDILALHSKPQAARSALAKTRLLKVSQ